MTQKKASVDCLLIHIGIPSIARGLYSIYYFLKNHNINTRLMIFNDNNDEILFERLSHIQDVKLVGISLHWHPQIVSSIKLAELVKCFENFKDSKIVFGGLTASVFKEELIKIPFIDFVIYGDGLLPIKLLYEHITKKEEVYSLKNVPNLVFKNNGQIYDSKKTYVVDDEILTKLELQAMDDQYLLKSSRNVIAVGRGCSKNCQYCGGSNSFYKKFIGQSSTITRKISNIHKLIQKAINNKITSLYFAADYDGKCKIISEYLAPFDLSNFNNVTVGAWGLPDFDAICTMFRNTKFPNELSFIIEISPETGNDKSRKSLGGNYFSNKDLILFIEKYFNHYPNFKLQIFFSYFLPKSRPFNSEEREFIIDIYKQFFVHILNKKLKIWFLPLSTDPGSILQSAELSEISIEVNSLNEYTDHMLKYTSNVGNFLKHFPSKYSKEDVDFLKELYLYENILREKYPKVFYGILYLFDNFKSYNRFLISCVKKIKEVISESEDHIFPLKNVLGFDKFNILGFNFSNDETYNNTSILSLLWLNTINIGLMEIRKDSEKLKNENVVFSLKEGAVNIQTKLDLLNFIIDYLQLVIGLKKNNIIINYSKNKRAYGSILIYNHLKIDHIRNTGVKNCWIIPVVNQFCRLVETNYLSIQYPVFSPNANLLLLGKTQFCKYLFNIDNAINNDKVKRILAFLGADDIESFRSNIPIYWEMILNNPEDKINSILSELIFLANIPVKKILRHNIPEDITQLHASKFFGISSDICSIELIPFFIHYYLNSKNISHYKSCLLTDNVNITIYILLSQTGQSIMGYLSPLENEFCKLCTHNNTLSDIYSSFRLKNNAIEEKVFIDMVIHLYNIGIII